MIAILNRLKWLLGLVLFQVLILNKMYFGGYVVPFIYIYFIVFSAVKKFFVKSHFFFSPFIYLFYFEVSLSCKP